ncbi:MAG TPA: phosphatase PAP2 family protein [Saprospiraceae bacterium]|nr:phosphatase PAP2 family protein [Saprospiraceae bacterium]MCC6689009.1 phosphatase PAP2 family protein [Saprospiraceae bacterium]HMX81811.1 phosphatase PAP2 family protein [Saprospiraceae bacterium]HMX84866.1 phosphatase PAP2 family protein [Saprospiraceae bacterium]HMZ74160.1 phosphatase PAP2 family protein [Saprospiraceae bacterium]
MKNIKFLIVAFALIAVVYACKKDVQAEPDIQAFTYDNVDENAGNWKPIYIADKESIVVDAPKDVNSPEYQKELADLKAATASLTSAQKAAVEYWGANSIVRWNQIAQELAAKYNLPAAENAEGVYPVPNASNPTNYPLFPFANPPYASRAFAYWTTAQFDAMIIAWKKKYEFKRPAPFVTDPSIVTSLPKQSIPSYPSEDAVVAQIAQDILTFMFPGEADFLAKKAAEHKQSRIWAGMNVQSDIAAGEQIAKQVSASYIQRAKTDQMKIAGSSPSKTDSLRNSAIQRLGAAWVSLEIPARPGMLPLYGKVKPWCIPSVEAVRPAPPPKVGSPQFNKDREEIINYINHPTAETRRIANYWSDGPSSSTPPGHWNDIAAQLIVKNKLNPIRTARVFAYMNTAVADAGISCWDAKYYYFTERPSTSVVNLKTWIGVPNFPSYTSGHSTFSAAGATVLGHFFPSEAARMNEIATEASNSRIYGGIHFRHDCEAGLASGKEIGNYSVQLAQQDGGE